MVRGWFDRRGQGVYLLDTMEETLQTADLADKFEASLRRRGRLVIPGGLRRLLWEFLAEELGQDWLEHKDPLVAEIKALSEWYGKREGPAPCTPQLHAAAYVSYFLPMNFHKLPLLLVELLRKNLLKPTLRVLDLGSGPGTSSLALIDSLARLRQVAEGVQELPKFKLIIQQVDQDELFLAASERLIRRYAGYFEGLEVELRPSLKGSLTDSAVLEAVSAQSYDLVIFCNVLNELADLSWEERAVLVEKYGEDLAPDGTLVLIAPAMEEASLGLRAVQVHLMQAGWGLFAPCFLPPGAFTPEACLKCWWVDGEAVAPIKLISELDLVRPNMRFTWALLRKDGRCKHEKLLQQGFRLPELEAGQDPVVAFCAGNNLYRDKHFRYKLCDARHGPNFVHVLAYRQLIHPGTEAIRTLRPGSVIKIENVQFSTRDDGTPVTSDYVLPLGASSKLEVLQR